MLTHDATAARGGDIAVAEGDCVRVGDSNGPSIGDAVRGVLRATP